ncbi:MAG TPA: hypothetical protein VGQ84_14795 [Gaiellaceae bacterium]|nr:hypothetical protein [Gaiellaceae bacterium]
MSTRLRVAIAFTLAAVVAAVAVALISRDESPDHVGLPIGAKGFSARTSLYPHSQLFGGSVEARLELLVDRDVVDPDEIVVRASFAPYQAARAAQIDRVDIERLTRIRYSFRLECFQEACLPGSNGKKVFRFTWAQVRAGGWTMRPSWPALVVASRLRDPPYNTTNPNLRDRRFGKPNAGLDWRAEVGVLQPTWRIDPTLATAVLFALALMLVGTSLSLLTVAQPGAAKRLWRRRRRLTPLERALLVLERASERGVVEEHRIALDDLATQLRALGARELAGDAYALAWDEAPPSLDRTAGVSNRARELITGRTNGRP